MKLVMRLGAAAIGLAALSACGQQDNAAENMDANMGMMSNESVLPIDDNAAGADTLGNQMNQLNETGDTAANSAANDTGANTTNTY